MVSLKQVETSFWALMAQSGLAYKFMSLTTVLAGMPHLSRSRQFSGEYGGAAGGNAGGDEGDGERQ